MSHWDQSFEDHPLHETLKEVTSLINTELDDADGEGQSEKRRLSKLINILEKTLDDLDPELVPYNILDEIHDVISENFLYELTAYKSNEDHQHLNSANEHLDDVLVPLSQLLAIAKKSETTKPIKGLEKLLDEFTKAIASKKEDLETEINNLSGVLKTQEGKLEELSYSMDTKKQETDSLIASWQEQHSDAQHKRESNFVAGQQEKVEAFADWKKEIERNAKTQIDHLIKNSTKELTEGQKNFDDEISSHIKNAQEKHTAILELHELVAGDSVASGYHQSADNEKKQANRWRIATVIFIIATAAWAVYAYNTDTAISNDGEILLIKLLQAFSVTGVLLFGAAYSTKQSNAHRKNETQARWFALEVKAIDPFISSLAEKDQAALKHKLSDRLFGQQRNDTEKETSVAYKHTFETITKGIIDILNAK